MQILNSPARAASQIQIRRAFGTLPAYSPVLCQRCHRVTDWAEKPTHRLYAGPSRCISYQAGFSQPVCGALLIADHHFERERGPNFVGLQKWRVYSESGRSKASLVNRSISAAQEATQTSAINLEDAMLYERQAELEEREIWQEQVDEAHAHSKYVPAATWDGMELVGGEIEWNEGRVFESFPSSPKLEWSEEITVATYRAIVEIFALLGASKPLKLSDTYRVGPLIDESSLVRIAVAENGDLGQESSVKIEYPNPLVEGLIVKRAAGDASSTIGLDESKHEESLVLQKHLPGNGELDFENGYTLGSLRLAIANWGHFWHSIALTDSNIKLALIQRITRISGIKVPDPVIHQSATVSYLLDNITKSKAPETLFHTLRTRGDVISLKNVHVAQRKLTPIDKEQEVGRWKVIKEELRARGLPILS